MFLQLTDRTVKRQFFELLQTPFLVLIQIAPEGVATNPTEPTDRLMRQVRSLQEHGFHLPANKQVGMSEALLRQSFDLLEAKGHLCHGWPRGVFANLTHQRPHCQSCESSICDRAQYIRPNKIPSTATRDAFQPGSPRP